MNTHLFLIDSPPSDWDHGQPPVFVQELSGWGYKIKKEAAGERAETILRGGTVNESYYVSKEPDDDTNFEENEELDKLYREKQKERLKNKHLEKTKQIDYYELLGLGNLRWQATAKEIKRSYRKMCLEYHPDKNAHDDCDKAFKKIQEAYETLSNEQKRRAFDSSDFFDDKIPQEHEAKASETVEKFLGLFAPVFARNSRFSIDKNVPSFGDETTDFEKMMQFYNFFWNFKSWRDFSDGDEFKNPEAEAESREEKRWMERQNERQRKKKKKEEKKRIISLTDLAYKYDPRILLHQQKKKEQKEAEKRMKIEEKVRLHREQVERQRIEEEQIKKEKLELQKKKKQLRKQKTKLRSFYRNQEHYVNHLDIDFFDEGIKLLTIADFEDGHLKPKCHENNFAYIISLAKDKCEKLQKHREQVLAKEKAQKQAKQATILFSSSSWSDAELGLLAKGLVKFPGGYPNRWMVLAKYIGGEKSETQIQEKVKAMKKNVSSQRHITESDFDKFKSNTKRKQDMAPSLTHNFDHSIKVHDQPLENAQHWTNSQQKALETGLKTIPQAPDKWDKIAHMVKGKTRQECIERFNYLRECLRAKKQIK